MYFRWDVSNFIVFLVAGLTVTFLLSVVLIEKFTCVPKRLSRVIVQLTGNKMLHQMMAITNVLTLLSCVLLPLVIFHFRFHHLLRSVFRSKKGLFATCITLQLWFPLLILGSSILLLFGGFTFEWNFLKALKIEKLPFCVPKKIPIFF